MLIEMLSKCLSAGICNPFDRQIKSALRDTDGAHAMVYSTWTSYISVRGIMIDEAMGIPKAALYNL